MTPAIAAKTMSHAVARTISGTGINHESNTIPATKSASNPVAPRKVFRCSTGGELTRKGSHAGGTRPHIGMIAFTVCGR